MDEFKNFIKANPKRRRPMKEAVKIIQELLDKIDTITYSDEQKKERYNAFHSDVDLNSCIGVTIADARTFIKKQRVLEHRGDDQC